MGDGNFLFEFATRSTAEQVIVGDWVWNNSKIRLDWWTPTIVATNRENRPSSTWTRNVGLPLHLWSQTTFRAIRDLCGGWIETEEETQLRNHLKWARIRVEGDKSRIPKEVTILNAGISYSMQLWTEILARFTFGEEEREKAIFQRSSRTSPMDNRAEGGGVRSWSCAEVIARKRAGPTFGSNSDSNLGQSVPISNTGPKPLKLKKPTESSDKPKNFNEVSHKSHMEVDKGLVELKTLVTKFVEAFKGWKTNIEKEKNMPAQSDWREGTLSCMQTEILEL